MISVASAVPEPRCGRGGAEMPHVSIDHEQQQRCEDCAGDLCGDVRRCASRGEVATQRKCERDRWVQVGARQAADRVDQRDHHQARRDDLRGVPQWAGGWRPRSSRLPPRRTSAAACRLALRAAAATRALDPGTAHRRPAGRPPPRGDQEGRREHHAAGRFTERSPARTAPASTRRSGVMRSGGGSRQRRSADLS